MSGWTEGYVTEIGYTHGYYGELKPLLMRQALLARSIEHRWPDRLRYLELGFGQGLSLNIHAAAMPGEYWGCDFNPVQVANAQALAAASRANVTILDSSFADLAARTDLPAFDVIALHGVWSWISEANRRMIVDIVRRHLAVGGVFYVSYNTTPGWSPSIPLRHLLALHAERASPPALAIEARIDAALAFARSLLDADATYFRVNTAAAERLKTIKGQKRGYLAHEYFNADWHPMPFSDMARHLADAKVSFATTISLLDQIDAITLTADQQKILHSQTDTVLRESVRDYLVNQQFRRDLWVKGPRHLAPSVQLAAVRAQSYTLVTAPDDIELKVRGAGLKEEIYRPLIAALADKGFAPKTVAGLQAALPGVDARSLNEALAVLSGLGHVHPTQAADAVAAARPACDRLNAFLLAQAAHSDDAQFLASPVVAGGIAVNRFQQLFLRSLRNGSPGPAEWAGEATKILWDQGQRLAREGKALESADETLAELTRQATEFAAKRLPILRALQVVEDDDAVDPASCAPP